MHLKTRRLRRGSAALAALLAVAAVPAAAAADGARSHERPTVYTLTNGAAGNAVAAFATERDGSLRLAAQFFTGGLGTGAGLGSQGALVRARGDLLLGVDAGSNDVAVLRSRRGGALALVGRYPSGGERPVSIAASDRLVYVLNAGGSGNVAGFRIGRTGALVPIAGSARPLSSAAAGGAQASFTPDGAQLVVTEKATGRIDVWPVRSDGTLGDRATTASAGPTPFGFAFGRGDALVVSEAAGGAPGASSVSSYRVGGDGALAAITAALPTNETAACWVVTARGGRLAYTTNAGSRTLGAFTVAADGRLAPLGSGVAATLGANPTDAAVLRGVLYALTPASGEIASFAIARDGALVPAGSGGGLAPGAVGLVVG